MNRSRRQGGAPARGFQLGPGVWTRLRYTVFDAEGERVDGTPAEVGLVFGYGVLLPALEVALAGLEEGGERSVELGPDEAFGRRDPAREVEFARDEFPAGVAEGERYEVERDDGTPAVLRVIGVNAEAVKVDLNHPLAGQKVRFVVRVLEARAATADELTLAEEALNDEGDRDEEGQMSPADGPPGLLPATSLLRRGVRS